MTDAILVAVDGRPNSVPVLQYAATRAEKSGERLDVVFVAEEPRSGERTQLTERFHRTLAEYDVDYTIQFLQHESALRTADAVGRRLLEEIDDPPPETEYQMIIAGNREEATARKWAFGSTTNELLLAREVPVLMVPTGAGTSRADRAGIGPDPYDPDTEPKIARDDPDAGSGPDSASSSGS